MNPLFATGLLGVVFGFSLSRIGFTNWDEVHNMFVFADLRMFLAFGAAVFALGLGFQYVRARRVSSISFPTRTIHRGTVPGALLFGAGWALSGACPSIALVQLGEGQLAALGTLAGIFAGNYLYSVVHQRFFRWDTGSCLDE